MSYLDRYYGIEVLKDKVLKEVNNDGDKIVFKTTDGEVYKMYHEQDCCESVYVESIVGDLDDLVGEPILRAEEAENLFDMIKNADKEEESDEYFKCQSAADTKSIVSSHGLKQRYWISKTYSTSSITWL